jgi:hypothetical protein
MARGCKRLPCEGDRLADVDGSDGDCDAKAEPVTAMTDLGDQVGGQDGRDHLGGEVLVELGGDPVRGAVEREFGILKHQWGLLPLRVRRLARVKVHVDLTIMATLAAALVIRMA